MNLRTASILLQVMLICSCTAKSVERNELELAAINYLSSSNQSIVANEGVTYFYQHFLNKDLTPLVTALWDLDKVKYPELNWQLIERDGVRLRVASLYAQWIKYTGNNEGLMEDIRDYVRRFRRHKNRNLRLDAVAFSVGLTKTDVDELQSIVLNDADPAVAAMAVFALADVEGIDTKQVLTNLYELSENAFVKKKIEEAYAWKGLGKLEDTEKQ